MIPVLAAAVCSPPAPVLMSAIFSSCTCADISRLHTRVLSRETTFIDGVETVGSELGYPYIPILLISLEWCMHWVQECA